MCVFGWLWWFHTGFLSLNPFEAGVCEDSRGGHAWNPRVQREEWQLLQHVSFKLTDEETQELLLLLPAKRSAADAAIRSCARFSGVHVGMSHSSYHSYVFRHSLQSTRSRFCRISGIFASFQEQSIFTPPPLPKSCPQRFVSRPEWSATDEGVGGGRGRLRDTQAGVREKARPNQTTAGLHLSVSSQNSCEQRADWRQQTNNSSRIE